WEFPLDPGKSATMSYVGLRGFNAATQQVFPLRFNSAPASALGKFLGLLDGTQTAAELQSAAEKSGPGNTGDLTRLLENLKAYDCLGVSPRSSIRSHWVAPTQDRDVIHLGHAALLYRQQNQFFLFDPWLMPWFAEMPIPSLWGSLLPRPAAIFLTHAHGETFPFEGGCIASVPFFGEDPCDIEMPRNCYLIADRGRNTLVHVDSGPTNAGRSALTEGVIDDLVKRYGPIATVFASQQQLQELRTYAVHACLSPPGQWLEVGEDGFLTNSYLAQLAT